ncbi:MAG: DUF115 domain-containing protein [Thermoplasmata archaeon]|nr:DUF115 domain-containing protein [Thermoplasmata archaeon]
MNWEEWKPIYEKILQEFGYDRKKDEEAARIAVEIARSNIQPEDLGKMVSGKVVSICGAGENLEKELNEIEGIVIAADEATTILLSNKILPDIITTDLDGDVDDIIKANEKGSIAVIHAHGDNIDVLKRYLPCFKGKIMLTAQSKPFDGIYNFGGFTDGDRAYCIAKHFKARKIKLVGFDFDKPKQKEGKNLEIKKKKLEWAKKIIFGDCSK